MPNQNAAPVGGAKGGPPPRADGVPQDPASSSFPNQHQDPTQSGARCCHGHCQQHDHIADECVGRSWT
eukprot:6185051-Amphidinium_carterae.1